MVELYLIVDPLPYSNGSSKKRATRSIATYDVSFGSTFIYPLGLDVSWGVYPKRGVRLIRKQLC